MDHILVGWYLLMLGLLLPTATNADDYKNILSEEISIYILIGIAVLYGTFTVILLILAAYCWCKPKRKPRTIQHKNSSDASDQSRRSDMIKTTLEPILEDPFDVPHTRKHKRLERLRSDEQELLNDHDGPTPASPTDCTNTVQDPIKKTPDPRRKKMTQQTAQQPPSSFNVTPRLPGEVSPSEKSPVTDKVKSNLYSTREMTKKSPQTVLPPLRNVPLVAANMSPSLKSIPLESTVTIGYDYYDGDQIQSVRRLPNQRLDSPRMRHKKHTSPSSGSALQMTHLKKKAATNQQSAMNDLDEFTANLNIEHDFKTPENIKKRREELETSFVKMNEGYKHCVGLLELYGELKPLAEHWYKIGLQVKKIGKSTLATIERLTGDNTEKCLHAVCRAWLSEEKDLTWKQVVMTLQSIELKGEMKEIVNDIKQRLGQKSESDATPNVSIGSNASYSML